MRHVLEFILRRWHFLFHYYFLLCCFAVGIMGGNILKMIMDCKVGSSSSSLVTIQSTLSLILKRGSMLNCNKGGKSYSSYKWAKSRVIFSDKDHLDVVLSNVKVIFDFYLYLQFIFHQNSRRFECWFQKLMPSWWLTGVPWIMKSHLHGVLIILSS